MEHVFVEMKDGRIHESMTYLFLLYVIVSTCSFELKPCTVYMFGRYVFHIFCRCDSPASLWIIMTSGYSVSTNDPFGSNVSTAFFHLSSSRGRSKLYAEYFASICPRGTVTDR
ncbi:hypothetical protein AR158_c277R [Paramecium bursaria Chlorella virus AR158]|uniref:hypothetical protein n=1 Tax=Paramecium bursaria Chlorella virus AR158 TaxID=380598 RepID=UPI00015AA8E4|nr:hypothetical protein AR158_c277R [Paramecium bursaria Chlorella virus AR158]ABU43822.1 hypothetical protein AR158_c277R [Paramecium bursaria Chlorella virus AR158]